MGSSYDFPNCFTKKSKFFRWHDSGDVQDLKHLAKIFKVARLTPDVQHWMPTREAWVKPYLSRAPKNLLIRFSMPMVDQPAAASWPHTSTVVTLVKVEHAQRLTRTTLAETVEHVGILLLKT
jgi:hypothetical protein